MICALWTVRGGLGVLPGGQSPCQNREHGAGVPVGQVRGQLRGGGLAHGHRGSGRCPLSRPQLPGQQRRRGNQREWGSLLLTPPQGSGQKELGETGPRASCSPAPAPGPDPALPGCPTGGHGACDGLWLRQRDQAEHPGTDADGILAESRVAGPHSGRRLAPPLWAPPWRPHSQALTSLGVSTGRALGPGGQRAACVGVFAARPPCSWPGEGGSPGRRAEP